MNERTCPINALIKHNKVVLDFFDVRRGYTGVSSRAVAGAGVVVVAASAVVVSDAADDADLEDDDGC